MLTDEIHNRPSNYLLERDFAFRAGSLRNVVTKFREAIGGCGSPIVAVITMAMVASPAQAHREHLVEVIGAADEVKRYVSYRDLDLASKAADRTLVRRVGAAVNTVCNEAAGGGDESTHLWCMSGAWEHAWPQVVRAERRAREIARTGASSLAATAASIEVGF